MAFKFDWPRFDEETLETYKTKLTTLINSGRRPPAIIDDIYVTHFNLGEQPPDIEILDMIEVTKDNLKAILKVSYDGDCSIEIKTQVQVTPLGSTANPNAPLGLKKLGMLSAQKCLPMPMTLRVSGLELMGILSLNISKTGVHAEFKNDPLKRIVVNSSFDEYDGIRKYLQRTIETQLRTFLVDDLPHVVKKASSSLIEAATSKLTTAPSPQPPTSPAPSSSTSASTPLPNKPGIKLFTKDQSSLLVA